MVTIPFLLLCGFFANSANFAPYLIPFKYFSLFKWIYQLLVENEFAGGVPLTCENSPMYCDPLMTYHFDEPMWASFVGLGVLYFLFKGVALIILILKVKISA